MSGRPVTYLLEPYLPTLAYTGFSRLQPQIPLITLDESAPGRLSASLTKPDGKVDTLAAEAPILQSFISWSDFNAYTVELSFAGPGRTYGVTTGLDSMEVELDQYGLHRVSLTATLRTLWGQELRIRRDLRHLGCGAPGPVPRYLRGDSIGSGRPVEPGSGGGAWCAGGY